MDPEDALIELLNGRRFLFTSASATDVYLDSKTGRPTDSFLEALKRTNGTTSEDEGEDEDEGEVEGDSENDSSGDNYDDEYYDDDKDDGDVLKQPQTHQKQRSPPPISAVRASVRRPPTVTDPNAHRRARRSSAPPHRGPLTATPTTHAADDAAIAAAAADFKDGKIRSLKLRVAGQLHTIRVLEGQLAESQSVLEDRAKQLAAAEARLLRHAHPAPSAATPSAAADTSSHSFTGVEASKLLKEVRAEALESVERHRAAAEAMQARLLDETTRRKAADERSRVLKEYAERAKAQLAVSEAARQELSAAVDGFRAKVKVLKRDAGGAAVEAAAQRNAAAEKEAEAARQRKRAAEAEGLLRHAHADLERLREDSRNQRVEAAMANGRLRALEQEVQLMRERDLAHRAEKRLEQQLGRTLSGSVGSSADSAVFAARRSADEDARRQDARARARRAQVGVGVGEGAGDSETDEVAFASGSEADTAPARAVRPTANPPRQPTRVAADPACLSSQKPVASPSKGIGFRHLQRSADAEAAAARAPSAPGPPLAARHSYSEGQPLAPQPPPPPPLTHLRAVSPLPPRLSGSSSVAVSPAPAPSASSSSSSCPSAATISEQLFRRAQQVLERDDAAAAAAKHKGIGSQRGRTNAFSLVDEDAPDDEDDDDGHDKENGAATARRGGPPRRSRDADPRPAVRASARGTCSRSGSPVPDSSLAKQRFERLEHMYDKVRGRMSWRSSDSEEDE